MKNRLQTSSFWVIQRSEYFNLDGSMWIVVGKIKVKLAHYEISRNFLLVWILVSIVTKFIRMTVIWRLQSYLTN
jgi:hypothetical protein